MNKEVIKKYKDAFDYWLNGGRVWKKYNTAWTLLESMTWNDVTGVYVQNDEYAEFRKALADGKTIQFLRTHIGAYPINPVQWLDWNSHGSCFAENTEYRIKPDEPKFKVGDWVMDDSHILKITESVIKYKSRGISAWFERIEPWKPRVYDVVICLDQPTPRIFEVNGANIRFVNDEFRKKRILPYIGQPLGEMK